MSRKNKFFAKRTVVDGMTFHSRGEANRYFVLKLMERAGKIIDLKRQVPFPLEVNGELICTYVADYVYREVEPNSAKQFWPLVVEDWKPGVRTADYRIKCKLLWAIHGIQIRETGAAAKIRKIAA